jgi:glycosyltransferase involved in cell wall biosynthesis
MRSEALVSLMIPAHKPRFLARTLQSAVAQTWPRLEILISDDSLGGEIARIVAPYLADPRLRYSRHPQPSGIGANYRHLLEMARGEWGIYLDDDDQIEPDAIARLAETAARHPSLAMIHAGYDVVDLTTGAARTICIGRDTVFAPGKELFLRFPELPPMTITVLFRISAGRAAGIFRSNIKSGDWEAWLKIALHGDVAYVPHVLGYHFIHDQGYSQTLNLEMDLGNRSFIHSAAQYAADRGSLNHAELKRWRRKMLRWYLTWIFAVHIPRCSYHELGRGFDRLLREDTPVGLAVALNPALAGALLLSPFPWAYEVVRDFYRRARFGPQGAPNF